MRISSRTPVSSTRIASPIRSLVPIRSRFRPAPQRVDSASENDWHPVQAKKAPPERTQVGLMGEANPPRRGNNAEPQTIIARVECERKHIGRYRGEL